MLLKHNDFRILANEFDVFAFGICGGLIGWSDRCRWLLGAAVCLVPTNCNLLKRGFWCYFTSWNGLELGAVWLLLLLGFWLYSNVCGAIGAAWTVGAWSECLL